ncbi:MAG TPA: MBL fold metallo-hydrolase [Candidatus Bathyarchaeia archaeon]|jgi:glyoxylase-like metal-dependent hydrolase (beta-lactamase superfamily II)|nr:MBL fold metallo-hydrolase [Candidatus Bathyarchaeia archaeon]
MYFKQIKHRGDNFSYIIADETTKEAAVVDPSFNADVITQFLKEQKFIAKYVINTHYHGDHTAGNEDIKSEFGAKIVAHKLSKGEIDISVAEGDVIKVGKVVIKVIHTPGHTPDSICLLVDGKLLTGDTLFVGECGRTDLQGGSTEEMYKSLFLKLAILDDSIEVYPGHDYGSRPHSTIGLEKRTNYTLEKRSLEEFVEFMKES